MIDATHGTATRITCAAAAAAEIAAQVAAGNGPSWADAESFLVGGRQDHEEGAPLPTASRSPTRASTGTPPPRCSRARRAVRGAAALAPTVEDRGPRRRPDRRLDRARRPRAHRGRGGGGLGARPRAARRRSSWARSTAPPTARRGSRRRRDLLRLRAVGALPALVEEALAAARPDCVVTDVGSTKRSCWRASTTRASSAGTRSPGPRPPASSTRAPTCSRARSGTSRRCRLLGGLLYERLHRFVVDVGARPVAVDPATHDRLVAVFSHLPHVLANVLASQAAAPPCRPRRGAAPGRPELPRHDARGRRQHRTCGRTSTAPTARRSPRRSARSGASWSGSRSCWPAATWPAGTTRAREDRRALLEADAGRRAVHELRLTVPNRPGIVAQVALELGRAGVNIVDLALAPASDMRSGAMTLWIAGEARPPARAS